MAETAAVEGVDGIGKMESRNDTRTGAIDEDTRDEGVEEEGGTEEVDGDNHDEEEKTNILGGFDEG